MGSVPSVPGLQAGHTATADDMNGLASVASFLLARPFAYVNLSTSTPSLSTTLAAITWDTKLVDTDGMWNAGSPDRLTIQTPGAYKARYSVSNSGKTGEVCITHMAGVNNPDNGTEFQCWASCFGPANANSMVASGGGLIPRHLYIGDYIRVQVVVQAACTVVTGDYSPALSLEWVSA